MGMFNYVDFECECPQCGDTITGFQTKDGNLVMKTVHPNSVGSFYSSCDNCGRWVDFVRGCKCHCDCPPKMVGAEDEDEDEY